MTPAPTTPEERHAALVEILLTNADVTLGAAGKRGFGSAALQVRGRIFAMFSHGRLVVKLPRQRVDALVAAGTGERFDPRHDGRLMKEWLTVEPHSEAAWTSLAREAIAHVASTH
jgi:hypothetical protein